MLYFSKLKIISVLILTLVLSYFSISNFFKVDDDFFSRNINLGLDLQGGSYLLLEIDNTPVIEKEVQNKLIQIKKFLKSKSLTYKNISIKENTKIVIDFNENIIENVILLFEGKESEINPYIEQFKTNQFDLLQNLNSIELSYSKYGLIQIKTSSQNQAIEIVKASRYFPQGLRGMGGASPANDFDISMPMKDRLKFSNDQIFITVMFESAQGMRNIDEITAIDGIDAITLGYQDLAQDLGVLGKPEQDDVLNQKRDLVIAAAKKHGKACAMMVNSVEQANHWRDQGVMLINYTSEVDILLSGYRDILAQIGK